MTIRCDQSSRVLKLNGKVETGGVLSKKLLSKILQISQENLLLEFLFNKIADIKHSIIGVSYEICAIFKNILFYRTSAKHSTTQNDTGLDVIKIM